MDWKQYKIKSDFIPQGAHSILFHKGHARKQFSRASKIAFFAKAGLSDGLVQQRKRSCNISFPVSPGQCKKKKIFRSRLCYLRSARLDPRNPRKKGSFHFIPQGVIPQKQKSTKGSCKLSFLPQCSVGRWPGCAVGIGTCARLSVGLCRPLTQLADLTDEGNEVRFILNIPD